MPYVNCQVERVQALTPTVRKIILNPKSPISFKAGQYVNVIMNDGDKRPFSIANSPDEHKKIELHIGAGPDNPYATEVVERLEHRSIVEVEVGVGNAYLRESGPRPTILMAGGTGFSYTRSILYKLMFQNSHEPIFLYWGAQKREDLYAFEELQKLDAKMKYFHFIPVLEQPPENWTGKTGWVHHAVLNDFVSLEPYYVYLAGPFKMAGIAREDFHNKGLMMDHLFGDAFDFI